VTPTTPMTPAPTTNSRRLIVIAELAFQVVTAAICKLPPECQRLAPLTILAVSLDAIAHSRRQSLQGRPAKAA
jgi:hypothetical protein